MSLSERYKSVTAAAAILRDVFGPHAAKKIARQFDVSIPAAKVWLAGRFPEHRTQQLIDAVRAEITRTNERNLEILRQLERSGGNRAAAGTSDEVGACAPLSGAVVARVSRVRVG
jgi:hypothetical protein